MLVQRFDSGTLGKAKRTPQNGIRVDARLTRVGVFAYRQPDGSMRRELRPSEEVFRADSLASLQGAPVTDLHHGLVTSKNWRDLTVGHAGDTVRKDGRYVAGELVVQDEREIELVENGERCDVSLGYRCRFDATPGVFEGEAYDGVQRDIVYNHVALLPKGHGRAGRDVSLRLDSNGDEVPQPHQLPIPTRRTTMQTKANIDGIEHEVGNDSARQAIEKTVGERDALRTRLDSMQKEIDAAKKAAAENADPAKIRAAVIARVALEQTARKVLPETERLDGLSDREVMEKAIVVLEKDARFDGKSDEYVRAYFDGSVGRAEARTDEEPESREDALAAARRAAEGGPISRRPVRFDEKALQRKLRDETEKLGRGPLRSAS